ncbi:MAG: N-acetyltransferase [Alphaproteobacteria bacterium]|nr:N-acetyltransferase [Alphaproteobacteria bacterium]
MRFFFFVFRNLLVCFFWVIIYFFWVIRGGAARLYLVKIGFAGCNMVVSLVSFKCEQACHHQAVDALHGSVLGADRFSRPSFLFRSGLACVPDLCYVVLDEGKVFGSIRYAPVHICEHDGLMLGPLVVHPFYTERGYGVALMRLTIDLARQKGHKWIFLVGDLSYYTRVGFRFLGEGRIFLPGPVDLHRVLFLELVPGAADDLSGEVKPGHLGRSFFDD